MNVWPHISHSDSNLNTHSIIVATLSYIDIYLYGYGRDFWSKTHSLGDNVLLKGIYINMINNPFFQSLSHASFSYIYTSLCPILVQETGLLLINLFFIHMLIYTVNTDQVEAYIYT